MMTQAIATTLELASGVTLAAFDSSTTSKLYRIELADGRHFQINEMLFELLQLLRQPVRLDVLKQRFVKEATSQPENAVSPEEIEAISSQLVAQGILIQNGIEPMRSASKQESSTLLALHYRRDLFSARTLAPFVRPFQLFFSRPLAIVLAILIGVAHFFTYIQVGLPPDIDMNAVNWPLFYVVILASILVHELGHLAACQRWGCPHGPLGIGLYFFNPVFYVDVTSAWRLQRWQRAVVDLAGVYLQWVASILFALLWNTTNDTTWLLAFVATDFFVISNLSPFIKLDGYWLLSDLSGIANLHTRVGDILGYFSKQLLAIIGIRASTKVVSPFLQWSKGARWTIGVYVVLSLVIWPLTIFGMVPLIMQMVLTYPALWQEMMMGLPTALAQGDYAMLGQQLSSLFLPTLMILNVLMLLRPLIRKGRTRNLAL